MFNHFTSNAKSFVILAFLIIVVMVLFVPYFNKKQDNKKLFDEKIPERLSSNLNTPIPSSVTMIKNVVFNPPKDWKQYQFQNYPLSFWYPSTFSLKELYLPKPPVYVQQRDQLYVEISDGIARIRIYPDGVGFGFEDPDLITETQPVLFDDQELIVSDQKITKGRFSYRSNNKVWYLKMLSYPDTNNNSKNNIITINYSNNDEENDVSKTTQEVFDKIIASLDFTN